MQSLKKRAAVARRSSIFAGLLYVLGCVALAAVAFFPLLELSEGSWEEVWAYGELGLLTFWKPFLDIPKFAEDMAGNTYNLLISAIYVLMLLVVVINAFRAIAKLDGLFRKGTKKIGYNQNKIALDKAAKIFSGSFAAVAINTLCLRVLLTNGDFDYYPIVNWNFTFYMAAAGFGFIHLLSGLIQGGISRFSTREGAVETPRKHGSFSVFLRNLFQFAAVGGITFFMTKYSSYAPVILNEAFNIQELFASELMDLIATLVVLLSWAVAFLFFLGLTRHAINPTEFTACEKKDKGRKSARVASFFVFLFLLIHAGFPLVMGWIEAGAFPMESLIERQFVLYAAAIGLGLFIIECIMAKFPLVKKRYREQAQGEETPAPVEQPLVDDVPQEESTPAAQTETPAEQPAAAQTVESVSVVAPVAQPAAVQPVAPVAAAPAPQAELPLSARAAQARKIKAQWIARSRAYAAEEAPQTAPATTQTHSVRCPYCFAIVEVDDGVAANCPCCGKKFALKKSKGGSAQPRQMSLFAGSSQSTAPAQPVQEDHAATTAKGEQLSINA